MKHFHETHRSNTLKCLQLFENSEKIISLSPKNIYLKCLFFSLFSLLKKKSIVTLEVVDELHHEFIDLLVLGVILRKLSGRKERRIFISIVVGERILQLGFDILVIVRLFNGLICGRALSYKITDKVFVQRKQLVGAAVDLKRVGPWEG